MDKIFAKCNDREIADLLQKRIENLEEESKIIEQKLYEIRKQIIVRVNQKRTRGK